jgi:flagellar biosynthesis chaperone FliJ
MTPADVIREVEEYASEYLQEVNDPAAMVAGILAQRIIDMNHYIDYLEKRIRYDSRSPIRFN